MRRAGPVNAPFTPVVHNMGFEIPRGHLAMAASPFSGDDTDSVEKWDACWHALKSLPGRDLPIVAIPAEAARIVNSRRAVTEARGIEHIEDRTRTAYRVAADRLATGADERLNRFLLALDGALNV